MIETIVDTFRSFKDNLYYGTPTKRKFTDIRFAILCQFIEENTSKYYGITIKS